MDSLIAAAGRALSTGDVLGALKHVGWRDDPPALALRGIAMAQLGDYPRARDLLRRAARNLLENARRYGGPDIRVQLTHGPGHISLRVNDRGPGVPDDQRERIFEPFYRLPGHAEHAGGVGLGLSLVRQIALKHGGQARCEAREGGGSCFVIQLPVAPSA